MSGAARLTVPVYAAAGPAVRPVGEDVPVMDGPDDGELLDVLDAGGRPRACKRRADVHRDGDWHRVFHCWVAGVGEGGPFVLLQRRGANKDVNPGRLDVSCAGHLAAGEADADGVRELAEELGVHVEFGELATLGVVPEIATGPGIVDRELCATYLLRSDAPLASYRPDPAEVAGVVRVGLAAFAALVSGDGIGAPGIELEAASRTERPVTVEPGQLVARPAGRYAWALGAIADRLSLF